MNKSTFLLVITAVSALGGLLFGYDTGVINGAQFYLSKHFGLDDVMKGWVVGSALLGCFIGAIVAGPLSIRLGRKQSLIISALLFSISAYGSGSPEVLPQTVSTLVLFRLIGGFGIGIASASPKFAVFGKASCLQLKPKNSTSITTTLFRMCVLVFIG